MKRISVWDKKAGVTFYNLRCGVWVINVWAMGLCYHEFLWHCPQCHCRFNSVALGKEILEYG